MKQIFVFALILVFGLQTSQAREYSQEELTLKKVKFQKMRTSGFTMAGIGSAMFVGGIFSAANGEWETVETTTGGSQANAKDANAVAGLLLLGVGAPLAITGFILGGIGSKKTKEYQQRLEKFSIRMEYGNGRKGLSLACTF